MAEGELRPDAQALGDYYATVLDGFSVQAHEWRIAETVVSDHSNGHAGNPDHKGVIAAVPRLMFSGTLFGGRLFTPLYERAGVDVDIAHSLAEVATRVPKAVICLVSALQFHEITLQLPRSV